MSKPRLTIDLLERILFLREEWEQYSHEESADEETHWDGVKYFRPIEEWAKAELEKRKLQAEKREEEKQMENARAMAASIIQIRKQLKENNNDGQ